MLFSHNINTILFCRFAFIAYSLLARCATRPPNIPNALARFYGLQHGSVVRYQCFPGYQLNTNLTEAALKKAASSGEMIDKWPLTHDRYSVKCEYGVWKGQLPSCIQGMGHIIHI